MLRSLVGSEMCIRDRSTSAMISAAKICRAVRLAQSLRASSSGAWRHTRTPARQDQVLMGCVSYDPAVSDIWEMMRAYMNHEASVPFDFVLFTNYEAQVGALLDGWIDVAWNGPVAHVMTQHLAGDGATVSLGMRDCDRDFKTVVIARNDSGISSPQELNGKVVATGASDSPQGHIVPLQWLADMKVQPSRIVPFDVDLGKHGDTAVGEILALRALLSGDAQAALVSDMMWQRGINGSLEGVDPARLSASVSEVPGDAPPVFDHCQFDALASAPAWKLDRFAEAIFKMDMNNPAHTEVMKLEGIADSWMPSREEGYEPVRRALAAQGRLGARGYCTSSAAVPRVAVIGGGVSGLQALRALQAKGFDVTLYEAARDVGGVWRDNYKGFGVQVPKQLFEFPDFPNTKQQHGEYPSGPQIHEYICDYVAHFGLSPAIKTATEVEKAKQTSAGGWEFCVKTNGKRSTQSFDYCVVATGMYSNENAFVPEVPCSDKFEGQIIHSGQFKDADQVADQKVLVVGNGKSAVDCALEAKASGAAHVTLLSRHAHWPTPRLIAGLIPFQYVFLSRLGQSLVVGHKGPLPGTSSLMSAWHSVGWPVMAGAFKAVEALFAAQFGNMSGPTSPFGKVDIVEDFYGWAQVLDYQPVSYTHLRAHETPEHLVCRLLLEKKKKNTIIVDQQHKSDR
eukprot:TRINITY_DN9245_c0_g1_i6.p1 TRINITY_DN9245_c0_g1~~TRINITY_DN9245_c0_g1_i6.p1  ORF type:complete len:680 (+),score=126.56 TRINITY_DN9245_c0_g1_i6:92-2131(+)